MVSPSTAPIQPRVLGRARHTVLLVALAGVLAACAKSGPARFMKKINATYVDVGEQIKAENFDALADDGRRLQELVARVRPYNDAADFQQWAGELADRGAALERAAEQKDLARVKSIFLDLNEPCASCHRVYRKKKPAADAAGG